MKKLMTAFAAAAFGLAAAAGTVQITALDVSADSANSVTGPQSNVIANALQPGATNAMTLAAAAANGGFAGTETIGPLAMRSESEEGYGLFNSGGLRIALSEDSTYLALSYSTLTYHTEAKTAAWSFERSAGSYDVAAIIDVDPKLDRSGGTATNLTAVGFTSTNTVLKGITTTAGLTVNGTNVPVNTWHDWEFPTTGNTSGPNWGGRYFQMPYDDTNFYLAFPHPAYQSYVVVRLWAFSPQEYCNTNTIWLSGGVGANGEISNGSTIATNICNGSMTANHAYEFDMLFGPVDFQPRYGSPQLRINGWRMYQGTESAHFVQFMRGQWRFATEGDFAVMTLLQ